MRSFVECRGAAPAEIGFGKKETEMKNFVAFIAFAVCVVAAAGCGNQPGSTIGATPEPACRIDSDCHDGDGCTDDACVNNICFNTAKDCDDGVACTDDACDAVACTHTDNCAAGEQCNVTTGECFTELVSTVDEILGASWLLVAYACDGTPATAASAFAVGDGLLATNAHVVVDAAEWIRAGGRLAAYQHESGLEVAVSAMWAHPSYTGAFSPDVGVVRTVGSPPLPVLSIASSNTLHNLNVFDEVRLSGFPGELIEINIVRPRATMLSGHITALRPFDQSAAATPNTAMLIQHDMPTTGGASGSPVVNNLGEVVAVHNSTVDLPGNLGTTPLRSRRSWPRSSSNATPILATPCLTHSLDPGPRSRSAGRWAGGGSASRQIRTSSS